MFNNALLKTNIIEWRQSRNNFFLLNFGDLTKYTFLKLFVIILNDNVTPLFQSFLILLDSKKFAYLLNYLNFLFKSQISASVGSYRLRMKIVGNGFYLLLPQDNQLVLYAGTSHLFNFLLPEEISAILAGRKKRIVNFYSRNKQLLINYSLFLYKFAKPDRYRGKGLRFVKQKFRFKEGKKKFV